jgi:hypothetical protein
MLALILAGIVALLVALLALPMELAFRASLGGPGAPFERSGRLRWAFGMVEMSLPGRKISRGKRAKQKPKREARYKKSERLRIRRLLLSPAAWERARVLLAGLVRAMRWRVFRFEARFGLDDPADTGQLWGAVGTILYMLPPRLDVMVQPVFEGPDFAFDGEAEIRLVPLRVIAVLLLFGLSPATWRVLWPVLKNR